MYLLLFLTIGCIVMERPPAPDGYLGPCASSAEDGKLCPDGMVCVDFVVCTFPCIEDEQCPLDPNGNVTRCAPALVADSGLSKCLDSGQLCNVCDTPDWPR